MTKDQESKVLQGVLEHLTDDNKYYGEYGRQFLSNSDIYSLLNNPLNFRASSQESKALLEGRYFHTLMLEPDKLDSFHIVDATTRNTKVYKQTLAEQGVQMLLLKSEVDEINFIADRMRSNLQFFDLIYEEGNQFERPGIKEIAGHMWKGKADIIGKDHILDLKTTSSLKDFNYKSRVYNYDSQAYIYKKIFGKDLRFLVVEKRTGLLAIRDVSPDFLASGEHKVLQAIEQYEKFFGSNPLEDITNYYSYEVL